MELKRRTPQGVRGLKYLSPLWLSNSARSHPARGAWIEILRRNFGHAVLESHPARGAWIEIDTPILCAACQRVAPRKGCVD